MDYVWAGVIAVVVILCVIAGILIYYFATRAPKLPSSRSLEDINLNQPVVGVNPDPNRPTIDEVDGEVVPIGGGGCGDLFKGHFNNVQVALKVAKPTQKLAFETEIRALKAISDRPHNHLIKYLCDFETNDFYRGSGCNYWVAMPFYEQGDLNDFLIRNIFTDVSQMLQLMHCIASGVDHLHRLKIVHRDLKSANILMSNNLEDCIIADFGLSVMQDNMGQVYDDFAGTKRYRSPEILREIVQQEMFQVYIRSDIYSMSLVFWELFSRFQVDDAPADYVLPYYHQILDSSGEILRNPSAAQVLAVVMRKRNSRPPFARTSEPNSMLAEMRRIIELCWATDPATRLASAEVLKRITELKNGS